MSLDALVTDIADAVMDLDSSRQAFRSFQPGVGPFGEPQLVRHIATYLNKSPRWENNVKTKRTPDLLIANHWALEIKIARPFGDNGKEAENWSVNLLHPYAGNTSTVGDCLKLLQYPGPERRGIIVVGYEHLPARINLDPLVESFQTIARHVFHIELSQTIEVKRTGLVHPTHQALRVFGWEVLNRTEQNRGSVSVVQNSTST